jgi:DNA-binding response OmpR family regulator
MKRRILMIEDDERLARMLSEYLGEHGFELVHRADARAGMALALRDPFDALILDVMLPDGDGFELCREIRTRSQVPIVMLTARGEPMDRIVGLELGADDYLPKPFDPRELLARLRAVLRRPERAGAGLRAPLRFGDLEIDPERRRVCKGRREVELTAHQFDLLWVLAEHAGRPVSRDRLMELVRGDTPGPFDRSVDVHVSRIRAAIEDDPRHPRRLLTVRGVGYLLTRDSGEADREPAKGSVR